MGYGQSAHSVGQLSGDGTYFFRGHVAAGILIAQKTLSRSALEGT